MEQYLSKLLLSDCLVSLLWSLDIGWPLPQGGARLGAPAIAEQQLEAGVGILLDVGLMMGHLLRRRG